MLNFDFSFHVLIKLFLQLSQNLSFSFFFSPPIKMLTIVPNKDII
nr:MAG TPA: hypothetical protein [Caudoviricetes sp.]